MLVAIGRGSFGVLTGCRFQFKLARGVCQEVVVHALRYTMVVFWIVLIP